MPPDLLTFGKVIAIEGGWNGSVDPVEEPFEGEEQAALLDRGILPMYQTAPTSKEKRMSIRNLNWGKAGHLVGSGIQTHD